MTRTARILAMLGGRDLFDIARDAGCTPLQLWTLEAAARGQTDEQIAAKRNVTRIAVVKCRSSACRKIESYLETEVVAAPKVT